MTEDEVRKELEREIARLGSTAGWARMAGVSVTWVDKVRGGKQKPSASILKPLGLRRVVTYERECSPSAVAVDPTSCDSVPGRLTLPRADRAGPGA